MNLIRKESTQTKKRFVSINAICLSPKMQIAFALAERDKTIRRSVLLPKQKKEDK